MELVQKNQYIENERLLEKFDEFWRTISTNFRSELQEQIRGKTREKLSTARVSIRVYEESVIAITLYQVQYEIYYKKGLKPKTQKEIGEMFDVSHMTVSRGNI